MVFGVILMIILLIISIIFSFNSQHAIPSQALIQTTSPPTTQSTIPNNTIPIVPGANVTVDIQPSPHNLILTTNTKDEGLYFTNTYTLAGNLTVIIQNPTPDDVNICVTLDFQLPNVPNLDSNNIHLTGDNISWVLLTVNPNELKFQTSQWGLNLKSGHKLPLQLTLTITNTQRSAIAIVPWEQSYPFTVSTSIN